MNESSRMIVGSVSNEVENMEASNLILKSSVHFTPHRNSSTQTGEASNQQISLDVFDSNPCSQSNLEKSSTDNIDFPTTCFNPIVLSPHLNSRSRSSSSDCSILSSNRLSDSPNLAHIDTSINSDSLENGCISVFNFPRQSLFSMRSSSPTHIDEVEIDLDANVASVIQVPYMPNTGPGALGLAAAFASANNNNEQTFTLSNNYSINVVGIERPAKLETLMSHVTLLTDEIKLENTWSEQDHSSNLYIVPEDRMIFHRHPVAQSTDAARSKRGYSSGLHMWKIDWSVDQRGTHALIGVGTKDAALHANGYVNLLGGQSDQSWGWNISTNIIYYNRESHGEYPSPAMQNLLASSASANFSRNSSSEIENCYHLHDSFMSGMQIRSSGDHSLPQNDRSCPFNSSINNNNNLLQSTPGLFRAPQTIYLVLDMDEGTFGFVVHGQFLGYAFRGLRGMTLYPMVSAVWGHCEVTLEYLNCLPPEPHSLMHSCRKQIRNYMELQNRPLVLLDKLPIPPYLANYLLYRYA